MLKLTIIVFWLSGVAQAGTAVPEHAGTLRGLLDLLNLGWVGSLIGIFAAIISLAAIPIAYILYRKSKVRPRLVYRSWGAQLVGSSQPLLPSDVKILFGGLTVPRVAVTHVYFWNAGTGTVRRGDVVATDPLRITFPGECRLLQVRVRTMTRNTISVSVDQQTGSADASAVINFEFLDPEDGAIIEMIHTAELGVPLVHGTVIGMPGGVKHLGHSETVGQQMGAPNLTRELVDILGRLFTGVMALFMVIMIWWGSPSLSQPELTLKTVLTAFFFLLALGQFAFAVKAKIRYGPRLPRQLRPGAADKLTSRRAKP